jgi:hypothetical protein
VLRHDSAQIEMMMLAFRYSRCASFLGFLKKTQERKMTSALIAIDGTASKDRQDSSKE